MRTQDAVNVIVWDWKSTQRHTYKC